MNHNLIFEHIPETEASINCSMFSKLILQHNFSRQYYQIKTYLRGPLQPSAHASSIIVCKLLKSRYVFPLFLNKCHIFFYLNEDTEITVDAFILYLNEVFFDRIPK
jgi:hypothetical protein